MSLGSLRFQEESEFLEGFRVDAEAHSPSFQFLLELDLGALGRARPALAVEQPVGGPGQVELINLSPKGRHGKLRRQPPVRGAFRAQAKPVRHRDIELALDGVGIEAEPRIARPGSGCAALRPVPKSSDDATWKLAFSLA